MTEHTFSSAIVKIGNSHAIRIPAHILKDMNAKEGESISVSVEKINLQLTSEILDFWVKKAHECKELKKFSDEKIILLARLSYNEGTYIANKLDNKYRSVIVESSNGIKTNLSTEDKKKMEKQGRTAQEEYRKNINKEFGSKILKELIEFRNVFDKKFKNIKDK